MDAILAGDLAAALGYRTPAGGVVVQAVAPIGLHDRERGTLGFTTSLGFSKKLERIAADPRVALAFHTRRHGTAKSSDYVLAQGAARVIEQPSDAERARVRRNAADHLGAPKAGAFWDRWLREYYRARVPVTIELRRLVVWPALDCSGSRVISGEPLAVESVEPQSPPRNGTEPRVDVARAASRLRRTEHTLLGFAGGDGVPVVLPVAVVGDDDGGIELRSAIPLPVGGRRAGLLGHSFRQQLVGLEARQHTGWLEVTPDGHARYSPHTEMGYKAPANKTLLLLLNGALAKRGARKSQKTGALG